MSDHRFDLTDAQVEAVITGRNGDAGLALLTRTVGEMKTLRNLAPSQPPAVLIAQAAAIAREKAPVHEPRKAPRPRRVWRLAPAAVSMALAFILVAPLAVLADASSPNDVLYPVDRFFERVGIGNGGLAERLTESEILGERGDVDLATQHLADSMRGAGPDEIEANLTRVSGLVADLAASGPTAETAEILDEIAETLPPGLDPENQPGNGNPNTGPGNNSGNGNTNPGQGNGQSGQGNETPGEEPGNQNPNAGPGNSGNPNPDNQSGQGNDEGQGKGGQGGPPEDPGKAGPGPENPNQGPGNKSGSGQGKGNGNPNQGPGNNSGNGNGTGKP